MHSLCREVRVDALLPDSSTKPLVWIKDFDEKWHDNYRYVKPVELPRGTRLRSEFTYDNSDANDENPRQPPVRVRLGPKSTDEMAELGLQLLTATTADALPGEPAQLLEVSPGAVVAR